VPCAFLGRKLHAIAMDPPLRSSEGCAWALDPFRRAGPLADRRQMPKGGQSRRLLNARLLVGRHSLSFHFIVRFEPLPGKEAAFREELLRVVEPSRGETGCLSIHVYESLRQPFVFAIHSEWTDEAAFELHATLPHTVRFLAAAETLLMHAVEGVRLRQIVGGAGVAR
jgi:quinol monooxygenase YgiN